MGNDRQNKELTTNPITMRKELENLKQKNEKEIAVLKADRSRGLKES